MQQLRESREELLLYQELLFFWKNPVTMAMPFQEFESSLAPNTWTHLYLWLSPQSHSGVPAMYKSFGHSSNCQM